jgi:intracellular septation protein
MKLLLDYSPLGAFLLAYWLGDIYIATAALMVTLWLAFFAHRAMLGNWSKTYLWVALVATVLGALTLYLRDPGFIKLKPTIIYGGLALALLGSHFVGDKVLLARMPQQLVVAPDAIWRKLNFAWAMFFAGCAALNLYVAHHFSEAAWVKFKVVGFTVLPLLFALAQAPFLARYVVDEAK